MNQVGPEVFAPERVVVVFLVLFWSVTPGKVHYCFLCWSITNHTVVPNMCDFFITLFRVFHVSDCFLSALALVSLNIFDSTCLLF